MKFRSALLLGALFALSALPASAQSHLLVVSGLGGEPRYSDAFHEWALAMAEAAESRLEVPAERVTVLTEDPERDPARIDGRATREAILEALERSGREAGPDDAMFILLIGHGSGNGEVSRLNLPGPDLTADDLAAALDALPTRKVVVVNSASASGGFIAPLSAPSRTVITATQSPFESNETRFGEYFVQAFTGDGADADRDGRVSMLEAFEFARREVEREYEEGNRLLTEHALLDDDGDGEGSREPEAGSGDGAVARTLFIEGGAAGAAEAAASPELRALRERQRELEAQVEALRSRRDEMEEAQYQRELEALLLELARTGQEIRELGGSE